MNPVLKCIACRRRRNMEVELIPYKLNSSLTIFMCTTNECCFPLNIKSFHKYFYKVSSGGLFERCQRSEVQSLKSLFDELSTRNVETTAHRYHTVHDEPFDTTPNTIPEYSTFTVFPIWKNKDALCWLDAALCLLVHSKNLKAFYKSDFAPCYLKGISTAYDEVTLGLNSVLKEAIKDELPNSLLNRMEKIREETFDYLKPELGCERGREDSPVFAIMALVRQNIRLQDLLSSDFCLQISCNSCRYKKVSQRQKTVVTIPSIPQYFSWPELYYLCPCFQCQKPDQRMTVKFHRLPPLLMLHFVEGLPENDLPEYDFVCFGRRFRMTGFIQYQKSKRHFVTWIRNDTGDKWMCCDDLGASIQSFNRRLPDVPRREIHVVLWEEQRFNEMKPPDYNSDSADTQTAVVATSSCVKRKFNYILLPDDAFNCGLPAKQTIINYKNISAVFEPFIDFSDLLTSPTEENEAKKSGEETASSFKPGVTRRSTANRGRNKRQKVI